MPDYFRLRQICLVAEDLPRVIGDMQAIFGVKLAYQDPHVRKFGLENALFPFGLSFVEVVSPVEADTAAGRFIQRSGGLGGYMAIFNCNDPQRRGAHAEAMGVSIAHPIKIGDFVGVQLHPRQCRAAMIEFDHTDGEEDLMGNYYPAGGTGWTAAVKTDVTRNLAAIEIESPDPAGIGQHWSRILEKPFRANGDGGTIDVDMTSIRFAKGSSSREMLRTLVVDVFDPEAMSRRAAERGYAVSGNSIEFCGVAFRLQRASEARTN